jgi:hypothetical protein
VAQPGGRIRGIPPLGMSKKKSLRVRVRSKIRKLLERKMKSSNNMVFHNQPDYMHNNLKKQYKPINSTYFTRTVIF